MIILLILLAILLFLYVTVGRSNKKMYCVIVCIALTVIAGLRSLEVGPDGRVYANYFYILQKMNFIQISEYFTKEPAFYYVTKLLQNTGMGLQGWYTIIGGLFSFSVVLIIYYYSEIPGYSILALFSLGYYTFSFTGLRQTVALSLILLSGIFLKQKKYIRYIVFVLLAFLFHNSAIIFLLILPFQFIHLSRKQYLIGTCLGSISIILYRGQIYNVIYSLVEETERFGTYKGYSYGL